MQTRMYLTSFRQVLEDGDLARVRADHAVVFVSRGQPEGDQAAHDAKRRLLQDGHLRTRWLITNGRETTTSKRRNPVVALYAVGSYSLQP